MDTGDQYEKRWVGGDFYIVRKETPYPTWKVWAWIGAVFPAAYVVLFIGSHPHLFRG